jgi:hypothetical protein
VVRLRCRALRGWRSCRTRDLGAHERVVAGRVSDRLRRARRRFICFRNYDDSFDTVESDRDGAEHNRITLECSVKGSFTRERLSRGLVDHGSFWFGNRSSALPGNPGQRAVGASSGSALVVAGSRRRKSRRSYQRPVSDASRWHLQRVGHAHRTESRTVNPSPGRQRGSSDQDRQKTACGVRAGPSRGGGTRNPRPDPHFRRIA